MPQDLYFLMPCSDLLLNFFNTFGLKIGDKIGPKNAILLSLFFELITLTILLYIPIYIMALIAMGIFGIGIATNALITVKNCWKYYPDKKGLIYGFNAGAAGISTSFFTPLADFWIINKDKKKTETNGLYPRDVADNLPTYLYTLIGIFLVLGIISYSMTFNYEDIIDDDKMDKLIDEVGTINEKKEEKEEKEGEIKDKDNKGQNNKKRRKVTYKELFKLFISKKNLQILVFISAGPCKYI